MGVLPAPTSSFWDMGSNVTVQTLLCVFVFVENIAPIWLLWEKHCDITIQ